MEYGDLNGWNRGPEAVNPRPTHSRCLGGATEGSRVVEKRILGARQGVSRITQLCFSSRLNPISSQPLWEGKEKKKIMSLMTSWCQVPSSSQEARVGRQDP